MDTLKLMADLADKVRARNEELKRMIEEARR